MAKVFRPWSEGECRRTNPSTRAAQVGVKSSGIPSDLVCARSDPDEIHFSFDSRVLQT